MQQNSPLTTILHTEEIKHKYSKLEREIKRKLTEVLLWDHFWNSDFVCRGLSFTKDFEIRELGESENNKHTINLANIKEDTIGKTRNLYEKEIVDLIERTVDDREVKEKYIKGIRNFLNQHMHKNISYLSHNKDYYNYISQYKALHKSKNKQDRMEFNIRSQVAKLMNEKFWDKTFVKKKGDNGVERTEFSDICSEYFYVLFYNANKVWTDWWMTLGQVFHDKDFPFIQTNEKKWMEKYLRVLHYLSSREKHNPYGKREEAWNKEWAKKTTQYADILRALSNPQLHIEELEYLTWKEDIQNVYWSLKSPKFKWDTTTMQLLNIGGGLLKGTVETHNLYERKGKVPFEFDKRDKSISSCVEKIIEGKKINDAIGFRISMQDVNGDHFEEIKKLSSEWIKALSSSFSCHPEKYVKKGQSLAIKSIQIDNKGVLNQEQIQDFISTLGHLTTGEVKKREKAKPSFIEFDEWKERMHSFYKDDVKDTKKWEMYSAFFKQFSWGKVRWSNGDYKDFKFNITVSIFNKEGKEIWEKSIEAQFDDINNGIGLANFNIRNVERKVNTQSNLTFNLSLRKVRKIVEESLKLMQNWADGKNKKFSKIDFWEGGEIDISDFDERTPKNTNEIDKATVGVINYFLKKWTFFLYYESDDEKKKPQENIVLDHGILTTKNLDERSLDNIQICSAQEVGKQQYSYLGSKENGYIGIYDPETEEILRWKAWEVMDRMNLGKIKDAKYYVTL